LSPEIIPARLPQDDWHLIVSATFASAQIQVMAGTRSADERLAVAFAVQQSIFVFSLKEYSVTWQLIGARDVRRNFARRDSGGVDPKFVRSTLGNAACVRTPHEMIRRINGKAYH
jgi:hypothetical protein